LFLWPPCATTLSETKMDPKGRFPRYINKQ
jgi:hypothetical protein